MQTFETGPGGARLRYLALPGSGVPLLMIHGLGCAGSYEYPAVALSPALAGRAVLIVDLMGHGYSDRPEGFGYGITDQARVLAGLGAPLAPPRGQLYGHSMGGAVAIELAGLLGPIAGSLVLAEANLDPGGGTFSREIAAVTEGEYLSTGHARMIRRALIGGGSDWAAMMRAAAPLAVHRGAAALVAGTPAGAPTWRAPLAAPPPKRRVLFGRRALPRPDAQAPPTARHPVAMVPEAGHSMSTEAPAALAQAIAQALSRA